MGAALTKRARIVRAGARTKVRRVVVEIIGIERDSGREAGLWF